MEDAVSNEFHWVGDRILTEAGIVSFVLFVLMILFMLLYLVERRRSNSLTIMALEAIHRMSIAIDRLKEFLTR